MSAGSMQTARGDRSESDRSPFRIADWDVDPASNRLYRGEEVASLEPKVMEVLVFLESFLVCLSATALGLSSGWLFTELLGLTGIDLTRWTSHNRYFLVTGVVHARTTLAGLVWPAGIALAVSLLAAYLPTRICRRRSTADLLRTD